MTPQQLMATGEWTRSGEWPVYSGEGPRYQHRTLDIVLQGYVTHRNSRRSKGIAKIRVWWLSVNGEKVSLDSRFSLLAEWAAVISINSATGCQHSTVTTARQREEAAR